MRGGYGTERESVDVTATLQPERAPVAHAWVLRPFAWLAPVAVLVGAGFQAATTAVADHFAQPYDPVARELFLERHVIRLLDVHQTPADFVVLLVHNLIVLAGFVVAAALLAGWRPLGLPLRRRAGVFVCVVLLVFVFVRVTQQTIGLMTLFPPPLGPIGAQVAPPSHYLLIVRLPHGPLEFGGLLLPLAAALWPVRGSRIALVLCSVPISVVLLGAAAMVETWVSPHLFLRLMWGV
jgi:hypothetical protein